MARIRSARIPSSIFQTINQGLQSLTNIHHQENKAFNTHNLVERHSGMECLSRELFSYLAKKIFLRVIPLKFMKYVKKRQPID